MMDITVVRIDDRLIHGQIVTAWSGAAQASELVVADDESARDEFQQSLMKMATPATMNLHVLSISDAAQLLTRETTTSKALVLLRSPRAALDLVNSGVNLRSINVGNLNMKRGKTKILNTLWLDQTDVDVFNALHQRGIKLELRTLPTDRSQNAMSFVAKYRS